MADDDPLALCQRELAAIVAATETAVTDILGAIEALRDAPPAAGRRRSPRSWRPANIMIWLVSGFSGLSGVAELVAGGDAAAVLRDGAGPSAGAIDQDEYRSLFRRRRRRVRAPWI